MVVVRDHQQREPSMGDITTIGLDLAKSVFQVHAVDEMGSVMLRKRLRRSQVLAFFAEIPPCLIGLEACATAHHWARELIALGHEARLMPPNYVKAYVKRNKHDVADAEAICEAVRRPSMRFVPVKTAEQQSALMMHRARDLLIRQRTRPKLVPYAGRFDGFHAVPASVSKTCLVRFDNNKYSVTASAIGRPVEVHAYADRIVIRQDGRIVAEHPRSFGRGEIAYDPWHYVPVLARKPGALRNGAPFKDWVLPGALERVRRRLAGTDDGDRQMVAILSAVLTDGLPAGEA